ncbi:MAG TPA: hypothetical protein VFL62_11600 [Bradyrhizobium sp.]|uniref:hypothetical protein n=1 Tax=Bradyrhizobium sp. TaxID=376 RepID=UPI002D7F2B47|nr:hypothetical protein [Bradyrhizobium sp.]HET7886863.1 hypothetical protein [Bradyrhizobium sp.]
MKKLAMAATFLLLTIGSSAVAQTGSSSSGKQGPWPAPVGHRQPRADEVPQGKDAAADKEKREDAELDRRIKSICRGC